MLGNDRFSVLENDRFAVLENNRFSVLENDRCPLGPWAPSVPCPRAAPDGSGVSLFQCPLMRENCHWRDNGKISIFRQETVVTGCATRPAWDLLGSKSMK